MKWILPILLFSNLAIAKLSKAPKNFNTKYGLAVFADFQNVDSTVTYDIANSKVYAETIISLETDTEGKILFDLVPTAFEVRLNDIEIKTYQINSPDNTTKYKMLNTAVQPGIHKLYIKNEITKNVSFGWSNNVSSAFWMTDLQDRSYIERYLPANLEFDRYSLNLDVNIIGKKVSQHKVYTNGDLIKKEENKFSIKFPEYFSASSFYFHLAPKNKFNEDRYIHKSIDGRDINVLIYSGSSSNVRSAKAKSKKVLVELEAKLGAWPHKDLVIYVAGRGGMEYCGATITSLSALGHELIHSYFARGVMPVDGNSGWMDEAIASWRDGGYKSVETPNFSSTSMAAHSTYRRTTDRKAYTQGANFMAYLNNQLEDQGGLIAFLKEYHNKFTHQRVSTKIFKKEIEYFSGKNFTSQFNKYILGKKSLEKHSHQENPYHPILSEKELLELL